MIAIPLGLKCDSPFPRAKMRFPKRHIVIPKSVNEAAFLSRRIDGGTLRLLQPPPLERQGIGISRCARD